MDMEKRVCKNNIISLCLSFAMPSRLNPHICTHSVSYCKRRQWIDDHSTVYYSSEWIPAISTTVSSSAAEACPWMIYILVIAHPDDETLFFLPTLCNILFSTSSTSQRRQQYPSILLSILCLSTGNYHQLGHIRIQELHQVVDTLAAQLPQRRQITLTIVDHNQLPDHPTHRWSHSLMAHILRDHIQHLFLQILDDKEDMKTRRHKEGDSSLMLNHHSRSTPISTTTNRIQQVMILSFDEYGVSRHVNHIDTFYGVSTFIHELEMLHKMHILDEVETTSNKKQYVNKTHFQWMTLQSISNKNPIRKYIPILEWIYYLGLSILRIFQQEQQQERFYCNKVHDNYWSCYMYQLTFNWKLMALHTSQFVWYRRLFILFSKYTFVNIWTRIWEQELDIELHYPWYKMADL